MLVTNPYTVLAPTPDVEKRLGRLRRRWDSNIKIDITEYVSVKDGKFLGQLSILALQHGVTWL
jgi:hypothetical protein